jgi:phosphodiesterase/alkaline phosphatase D-like protein
MWNRLAIALVAAFLSIPAAGASAANPATTGGVTDLTSTSAALNGVADPSSNDSSWYFQYGTSTSYGQSTKATSIGSGSHAVKAPITGLTPGQTYHYRLVVVENVSNSQPTTSTGSDLTFTTPTGSATTGDATSITTTSALLNGVVSTNSADSAWAFQYGTTTSYGKLTKTQPIGAGVHVVSMKVTDLKPGTTYHFRLIVSQSSYGFHIDAGEDHVFTTTTASVPGKYGRASLRSHRLTVHRGIVSIPLSCAGAKGTSCSGKISITSTGRFAKKLRKVGCGKAALNLQGGQSRVLKARISRGCAALLKRHKHHRLGATLRATFSTHQSPLRTRVTLIRR